MKWNLVIRDGMPKPKPDELRGIWRWVEIKTVRIHHDMCYPYIGYWFDDGDKYVLFGIGWWDRDKPVWQASSGLSVKQITHWAELEPPK